MITITRMVITRTTRFSCVLEVTDQGLYPLVSSVQRLYPQFLTSLFTLFYVKKVRRPVFNNSSLHVSSTNLVQILFLVFYEKSESESHSVVSDSLQPHGLYSPWNSPGQNTGVGSHSLLQGIFPTQGSNPGLLHCRQSLYCLSHQGRNVMLFCLLLPLERQLREGRDYFFFSAMCLSLALNDEAELFALRHEQLQYWSRPVEGKRVLFQN